MSKYTWIKDKEIHHTRAPFSHWLIPTSYSGYIAVFSLKHSLLNIPLSQLTDETRQRLLLLQPLPFKEEPTQELQQWMRDEIPF